MLRRRHRASRLRVVARAAAAATPTSRSVAYGASRVAAATRSTSRTSIVARRPRAHPDSGGWNGPSGRGPAPTGAIIGTGCIEVGLGGGGQLRAMWAGGWVSRGSRGRGRPPAGRRSGATAVSGVVAG